MKGHVSILELARRAHIKRQWAKAHPADNMHNMVIEAGVRDGEPGRFQRPTESRRE